MGNYIVSFDVGGTRLKGGAVEADGGLSNTFTAASMASDGAEKLFETICTRTEQLMNEREGTLKGIGLSLSGGVDPEKGVVLLPGKYKSLENYPLVQSLRERFGLPVYAENDGRLAAYAAKYYGEARDRSWVVVLTLGTGVGSGVILDGQILADPYGLFGAQLGHLIMDKDSRRVCLTGNPGTAEMHCSATALALQVRDALQRGLPSALTEAYFKDPASVTFQLVTEAARQGDALCKQELDTWTGNLVDLLINAVHCYSPELIVLSGGATLASDLYLDRLRQEVNQRAFKYPRGRNIEIVVSDIQEYQGVLGAAAYVWLKIQ